MLAYIPEVRPPPTADVSSFDLTPCPAYKCQVVASNASQGNATQSMEIPTLGSLLGIVELSIPLMLKQQWTMSPSVTYHLAM